MRRFGACARSSLGPVCPACGIPLPRVRRTRLGTAGAHPSLINRSRGTVFPDRICLRDSKMSSIVLTLRRSSNARAMAYRTNSDFDGNPRTLDASVSNFACSFVSLRLMVSTGLSNTGVLLKIPAERCTLGRRTETGRDDLDGLSSASFARRQATSSVGTPRAPVVPFHRGCEPLPRGHRGGLSFRLRQPLLFRGLGPPAPA